MGHEGRFEWLALRVLLCIFLSDMYFQAAGSVRTQALDTEVVFESLWPGRSRYASMCKLAASWQIWQRKDILLVLSILSATSLNH